MSTVSAWIAVGLRLAKRRPFASKKEKNDVDVKPRYLPECQ
jgi:hypothetical protein